MTRSSVDGLADDPIWYLGAHCRSDTMIHNTTTWATASQSQAPKPPTGARQGSVESFLLFLSCRHVVVFHSFKRHTQGTHQRNGCAEVGGRHNDTTHGG